MVEQILGFAGIQSGREKYDLQPVDVRAAIDRAVAACDPQILAAGCEVSMDVPADLPRVQADPTSLVHCLRNLVENAVTHGAQGKWIGIRAAALVKRIVEAHSGTIRVEGAPGNGTCFLVRIPAAVNSEENVGTKDSVDRG